MGFREAIPSTACSTLESSSSRSESLGSPSHVHYRYNATYQMRVIARRLWIHEGSYTPVIPEGNTHEAAVELVKATE